MSSVRWGYRMMRGRRHADTQGVKRGRWWSNLKQCVWFWNENCEIMSMKSAQCYKNSVKGWIRWIHSWSGRSLSHNSHYYSFYVFSVVFLKVSLGLILGKMFNTLLRSIPVQWPWNMEATPSAHKGRKGISWKNKCVCVWREIERESPWKKTGGSKFGLWASVYVTSDLRHFWEPAPS